MIKLRKVLSEGINMGMGKKDVEKMVSAFISVQEKVMELYEVNGPGHKRDPIECPMCNKESLNYWCNWGDNDHIHLNCSSCNWTVMQ